MATRPTTTMQAEVLDPDDDMMQAARSLGELQKADANLTITQERNLFGDIVTARPMQVLRNEARILKKIDIMSAAAGTRFFYRYPVRNRRSGTTDFIEGASVKATDAVLMLYMNAAVESRTVAIPGDKGGNYICYSRFCDWENGVSLTMGQLVPRSATLGGEDEERRQQIAHNVGQSKSRRNVVNAALGEYVHRAFQAAKHSLVERIGRDIEKSRRVIGEELAKLGVPDIVPRVERVYGRKVSEWLAPDIARVYAEIQAVEDGMSSIDETWPAEAPPEPRRTDDVRGDTVQPGSPAVSDRPAGEAGPAAAQDGHPASPPVSEPERADQGMDQPHHGHVDESMPKNWTVGADTLGQENIIRRLMELLELARSTEDIDEIEKQNAERLAKITGNRRANLNVAFRAKRESLQGDI